MIRMISAAVCSSSAPTTSTSASWARIFIDNFITPSSLYRLAIISCEPPPPPPPALEPVQLPARTNVGRLLSPPSSAFRLFAFAPAARRLWRGIRRTLLVYTTTSPEPIISDAFAADTDDASSDPVCGSVFDALDTTLIGPEERHKLPVTFSAPAATAVSALHVASIVAAKDREIASKLSQEKPVSDSSGNYHAI
ncbi:hypothetical protein EMIHUDRAFT_206587 [Emiliania huxleyi CCMP1516]|uniref:Uncharacterized protein n=2 Tax=Emiliania huxleyi TaxID=2903 RepID=A0A0D3JM46_EMIH1|nr:hypothetical protein EMIHUDRAFT_206587 [Emiliania huxleyi CCMP1516]EOD24581.1 hypothetical protein EMIHUDRAFT_206587 [Emiliania huxleyi CCMP1516]|eukprot:XP_005777010.1 hypothetical protein EMIHUDRAFT_206587 [Emiliania huxleyi CCMP1516]